MSIPHIQPNGIVGGTISIPLPRPLSPSDVAAIRRIFVYQSRGNIPEAIREIGDLRNDLLMGSVLADRYLGRYHRSTTTELADWLERYRDQPDAPAIHALLSARLHAVPQPAAKPDVVIFMRSSEVPPTPDTIVEPRDDLLPPGPFDRAVVDLAQRGKSAKALRMIADSRAISPPGGARLRAEVARALFIRNEDAEAVRVAQDSIRLTAAGDQNGLTYFIGGLAAWRLDRFDQARNLFESGASAATSSPKLRAANAFWASRANRQLHQAVATVAWLRRAAQERTTFYGLLARRMLRLDIGLVPDSNLLTEADVDAVAATPYGWRAFALLQVDQPGRAELELRALWPQIQANPLFGRSVLMVASATGMNDLAAQLALVLPAPDGHRFDALGYPIPRLHPAKGFTIDPALVYALSRTESNFDPAAISSGGARGLMQIMPATARYIAADLTAADSELHNPSLNLEIGQRYVAYLAHLDGIDNDLIRLLASYNDGPGNMLHWVGDVRDNDDPLLFIESIPVAETRAFVPDVLAASWIYAALLHRPAPSLDSLAAGEFPRFTPLAPQGTIIDVALRLN